MRRSDIPTVLFSISPDAIETAFPTDGVVDPSMLPLITAEIWGFDRRRWRDMPPWVNPGCVVFPLVYHPIKPLDPHCPRHGGDVVVPVCHRVWSDWPLPPIPVINDRPLGDVLYHNVPLLTYPAFRIDERGRLAFRWDQKLHALPSGRYEVRIVVDKITCGTFELDKRYCCPVKLEQPTTVDLVQPEERGPRPAGISDMFDEIYEWSSVTTCQIDASTTVVTVADRGNLCDTLCKQPELVITDG
ncbi:MAG: hypothetical protein DI636_12260, partial [Pelagerythrobacter marensis]